MIRGSDWGGSKLATAQTCKQKYFNRYERVHPKQGGEGLIRIEDSYAACRGTLLHTFLQSYYDKLIVDSACDKRQAGLLAIQKMIEQIKEFNLPPAKIPLLQDEVISAADQYLTYYAADSFKPVATEVPIEVEIKNYNGEIIKHTGIIDLLVEYMGAPFIVDHKTTTRTFDTLFSSYEHNLSFKGYCRGAAKKYGQQIGVVVNGIRFKGTKSLEVEFEREPRLYSEKDLADFEPTVISIRRELDICREDNFWPKSGDQCVQVWGKCDYFPLCKFDDPAMVNALYMPGEANDERATGIREPGDTTRRDV